MLKQVSKIVGAIVVCFYALLIFYTSFNVSGTCLQDPDTCWLLAMGRVILAEKAIPQEDPFSYTMEAKRHQEKDLSQKSKTVPAFTPYQWLSEVTIFGVYRFWEKTFSGSDYSVDKEASLEEETDKRIDQFYKDQKNIDKNFGLPDRAATGLTVLTSLVIVIAFIWLPTLWMQTFDCSKLLFAVALIWFGLRSAWFHFYLRPEIFSYLFLAVFLFGLNKLRVQCKDPDLKLKDAVWFLVFAPLTTVFWANFHSGFILGFILLTVMVSIELLRRLFVSDMNLTFLKITSMALVFSTVASFVNPFGAGLWSYLPHLFFAKTNLLIEELRPLTFFEMIGPSFSPFVLLSTASFLYFIFSLFKCEEETRGDLLKSSAIVLLAIIVGFSCRRLMPFCSLIMVFELLLVICLVRYKPEGIETGLAKFLVVTSEKVSGWMKFRIVVAIAVLAICIGSSIFQCRAFIPRIPQFNVGFAAPFDTLAYIEKNKLKGNLFNDPQFGDMLIWHLKNPPEVFIDTRFDAYGSKLVFDSWKIESGHGEWKKLMDEYRISWVFVPANTMLAEKLKDDPGWELKFKDIAAVIYKRKENVE